MQFKDTRILFQLCHTKKVNFRSPTFFVVMQKQSFFKTLFVFCLKPHNCKKIQYEMTQRYRILCIKMLQYISDFNYFTTASELMSVFQGDILVFHFYLTLKQSIQIRNFSKRSPAKYSQNYVGNVEQFYIQLVHTPHLRTIIFFFGPFWQSGQYEKILPLCNSIQFF